MADPTTTTPGGTAQSHPEKDPQPFLVAPTTQVDLNTIKAFLIPVGCWRVDDVRFAFDSSVVHPDVKTETGMLETLRKAHAGAPLSIFGHADPTGPDDYNKTLSGRRATAVYALLTRDVAKWEKLYSSPFGGDTWGLKSIQLMLNEVTGSTLVIDGQTGPATSTAVKNYQQSKGVGQSGSADQATRALLFADYMDKVCLDAGGKKFQLQKTDFLAKGADPDGKGDFQGCGEFNPFVVFSTDETTKFQSDHTTRDRENAPNRRVMALLFKPGTVISTAKWPCPKASEGMSGCQARFWKDGDTRRNPQAARRTFDDTKDTYGCRFYHRLFVLSPCGAGQGPSLVAVLQINASIPGTKGVRVPANQRPLNPLTSSTSLSASLTDNPPVILVQGCTDVDLEAVLSSPANVTWTVTPNQNSNPAPAITPDATSPNNTKAKLSSAQGGSFSVTASVGSSKVVWNVVFVSVQVTVAKTAATYDKTGTSYGDGFELSPGTAVIPSDVTFTRLQAGRFDPGTLGMEVSVNEIKLLGGGTDQKLGIDQILTHALQNVSNENVAAHYHGGKVFTEVPLAAPNGQRTPATDSNGDASVSPFGDAGLTLTGAGTALRTWKIGDSPGSIFARALGDGSLLERIDGAISFHLAVASTSTAAPNAIVVHCDMHWQANMVGTVATSGVATFTPNGAGSTGDAQMALLSPATNGEDAGVAGFDTFEPRFNAGRDHI
ncbi:MAG TPA: peptidoglycan-binding protein [Bryobacteraceae bacterium]|jgi:hypothetical protein